MIAKVASEELHSVAAVPAGEKPRPWLRALVQLAITCGLFVWLAQRVDLSALKFSTLRPGWVVLGVLTTFPQLLGTAWRWRFTALRLSAPITLGHAVREYYLAALFNQLLPSGMAGDALRVMRHGKELGAERGGFGRSLQVIVLERVAGQIVLWTCVLLSAPLWLPSAQRWLVGLGLALLLGALGVVYALPRTLLPTWLAAILDSARTAWLERGALPVQLATSLLTLAACIAMFACAACAMSAPLSLASLLRIAPLALASMALPISFAGWGVRELASSALYGAAGLDPAVGAATSILYGLMFLAGCLPAVLYLRSSRQE